MESSWPSSDSSWRCYYMLRTATKLSMSFPVLKEIFFLGVGLRLTSKEVQKQDLKKTLKDVGMAYQKVCKQGI